MLEMILISALMGGMSITSMSLANYSNYRRFSKELAKANIIDKNSIIWNIAPGLTGSETAGIGTKSKVIYGIDPLFLFNKGWGRTKLVKGKIKDILEMGDLPSPDLVISIKYTGIHRVIKPLLNLESKPIQIHAPCHCTKCGNTYFGETDLVKSKVMQAKGDPKPYSALGDRICSSILDMQYLAIETGFHAESSNINTRETLVISPKNNIEVIIRSIKSAGLFFC